MAKLSLNYYEAVHVGKVKTDVIQFTTIQAAITAITDNLTTKRYAVYVHPGTYTEKITMKPNIDLIAIGGRAETVIAFTATVDDEPTVTGENSLIKGFTISSTGAALRARCVQAATTGFVIENCSLQVVTTGAAAIVLNAIASCTITDCAVDIAATAATAALFTTGAATYTVNDSVFGGATDSIQVTTTPTVNLTGCTVSNNFNQDGGTVAVVRCHLEALDCATAACTFSAELSRFTASITTAGALAHALTLRLCDLTGQGLASAANLATTMQMESCSHVGAVSNAGTGAFSIGNSDCTSVSQINAAGSITIYGGFVGYCLTSTGSVVWWINDDELKVLTTMKIAHALAVATSGDVILLDQAVFAENNLTAGNGVDIVGLGSDLSIVEDTSANPIITVGNNVACGFRGLRMSNLGAGAAIAIAANAAAATLSAQDCEFRSTASIVTLTTAGAGVPQFTAASCIFRTGTTAIAVTGAVVGNTIVRNSTFAACTLVFSTTGENHTFAFDACDFGAGGVTLTANVPVVALANCEDIGTFTHSTASTVTLQHCRLSGAYTTGAVAAIVTAYATTFANFTHGGTGALTFDNCRLGDVANNNIATATIRDCTMGSLTQAAFAGTINVYNSSMGNIIGNGGTIRLEGGCRFADIAANAGVLTWKVDPNHIKVVAGTANMKVADALTLAAVGDVITIYPGTYAESNLTLKASVDLVGTDPDQCLIVTAAGNPILNAGVTCTISNLTIGNTAGGTAITVTANTLTVRNCYVYGPAGGDAIAMTAGTLVAYDTSVGVGDIDLSTAPCTLTMYRCQITADPIDTAATAFAHAMTFEQCDFGGQNIASLATVGTTLALRGCTNVNAITNAGTGAFTIRDSDVVSINNTVTGTFTIYGGYVNSITRGAASVVWWKHSNELCVLPSATTTDPMIASALAVASSGDVIKLTQGTFAESLTAKSGVNIMGEGWGLSIIETTNNGAPIIAVGDNITCEIHGVKISNLGTGGAIHVEPVANASALTLEDCLVSNAGASDCVAVSIGGAGSGTLTARRCNFDSDAANSIVVLAQTAGAGFLFFNSWDCRFTTSGGAANAAIEASAAVVADVNVFRATFASCTLAVYSTGANHTVDIEDSEFSGCGVELAANAPTVTLTKCNSIGIFTHSVACTVTLRDCYISNTYTIGAVAGIVNAYRTQFTVFTNGGLGAIAFQECNGTDINNASSTMTIEGGHWDTVLQGAAAGTINIKEAVIATELDCSAAGAINAYNCEVADVDGNGGTITVYGGTLRAVTDATGTVLWKTGQLRYEVITNMKIQDALTAGAGGEVIIHAGSYAPIADLTVSANTLVTGEGKATIITPTGAAIANGIVLNGNNITLKDMKVILAAGAGVGGTRPNCVYATGRTLLWLESLWLYGDQSIGDDASDVKQNGVCFVSCTYCKVISCQVQTNRRHSISLNVASNYNTLTGNTCSGNNASGIRLDASLYNTITGNTYQGSTTYGIEFRVASNLNTITGNSCQGNGTGMYIGASTGNTITGNTCSGNTTSGIILGGFCHYTTITGNTCQGNGVDGIFLYRSSYCVVTGNNCRGNTANDGIVVTGDGGGNSDYNTLTGNVCTGNGDAGIAIEGGANANKNIVVGNSLLGNTGTNLVDNGTATELGHNITA